MQLPVLPRSLSLHVTGLRKCIISEISLAIPHGQFSPLKLSNYPCSEKVIAAHRSDGPLVDTTRASTGQLDEIFVTGVKIVVSTSLTQRVANLRRPKSLA